MQMNDSCAWKVWRCCVAFLCWPRRARPTFFPGTIMGKAISTLSHYGVHAVVAGVIGTAVYALRYDQTTDLTTTGSSNAGVCNSSGTWSFRPGTGEYAGWHSRRTAGWDGLRDRPPALADGTVVLLHDSYLWRTAAQWRGALHFQQHVATGEYTQRPGCAQSRSATQHTQRRSLLLSKRCICYATPPRVRQARAQVGAPLTVSRKSSPRG